VHGDISGVMKLILRRFFPEGGVNFATTGVLLPAAIGGTFHFKAKLCYIVVDEKAHKNTWQVKGAKGTNCCLWCKNVLFLKGAPAGDYIADVQTALPHQFDLHSAASFYEMADVLQHVKLVGTAKEFDSVSESMGLNYDPHSLVYDLHLRQFVSPENALTDTMHNLFASSGVAQYEVNAFLHSLLPRLGGDLEEVDAFQRQIQNPPVRLSKDFFQMRVNEKADGHIKAFASETMAAVNALSLYAEFKLEPLGAMRGECHCLKLLQAMIDIIFGGSVVEKTDELQAITIDHHKMLLAVYGTDVVKRKPHYQMHFAPQVDKLGEAGHCFSLERKHKLAKTIATQCKALPSLESNVLLRCLHDMFSDIDADCEEIHLVNPKLVKDSMGLWDPQPMFVSTVMQTGIGHVHKGNLLAVRGSSIFLGVAQFFVKRALADVCLVCFTKCVKVGTKHWATTDKIGWAAAGDIRAKLHWIVDGGLLRPRVPYPLRHDL